MTSPALFSLDTVRRYGIWIILALAFLVMPKIFTSGGSITTMCLMGIMIIFSLSYNMLLGQTGLLSFGHAVRSEEHTSELQSLMRISYAVFCLQQNIKTVHHYTITRPPTNTNIHHRYTSNSNK